MSTTTVSIDQIAVPQEPAPAAPMMMLAVPVPGVGLVNVFVNLDPKTLTLDMTTTPATLKTKAPSLAEAETPGGAIDGKNTLFTLVNMPNPVNALKLYRGGARQSQNGDYSVAANTTGPGSVITFVPGAVPQPGSVLIADYPF